jgi:hypothetical protein
MMVRVPAILGGIAVAATLAATAHAADVPPCGQRTVLVEAMKNIFGESPQATGVMSSNELFEVFVSPAGTWTILITNPHGISCVAAAGENWDRKIGDTASRQPMN